MQNHLFLISIFVVNAVAHNVGEIAERGDAAHEREVLVEFMKTLRGKLSMPQILKNRAGQVKRAGVENIRVNRKISALELKRVVFCGC